MALHAGNGMTQRISPYDEQLWLSFVFPENFAAYSSLLWYAVGNLKTHCKENCITMSTSFESQIHDLTSLWMFKVITDTLFVHGLVQVNASFRSVNSWRTDICWSFETFTFNSSTSVVMIPLAFRCSTTVFHVLVLIVLVNEYFLQHFENSDPSVNRVVIYCNLIFNDNYKSLLLVIRDFNF